MYSIYVINKHKSNISSNKVVFNIMRPTALGNPFKISKQHSREIVVCKYRRWLWEKIQERDYNVCSALSQIKAAAIEGDVYLECCCAPKKCHGDIIKSCVEWMIKKGGYDE